MCTVIASRPLRIVRRTVITAGLLFLRNFYFAFTLFTRTEHDVHTHVLKNPRRRVPYDVQTTNASILFVFMPTLVRAHDYDN